MGTEKTYMHVQNVQKTASFCATTRCSFPYVLYVHVRFFRTVKCVLHKFPFLESSETSKIIPKSKLLFIYNSYYITYFYLYYTNLLFIYIYIILHNIISIFIIHILRKFEILIFER